MSAAVMSNASMKWEQVGSKKRNGVSKPSSIPTLQKAKTKESSKMPSIETLPPIKVEKSIYDLLDREDSSDEDTSTKVQPAKIKPQPATSNTSNGKNDLLTNGLSKKSPKPQKQNQNSLRLTSTTTSTQQSVKKNETDFDSVMSSLNVDEFKQEHKNFLNLFSNAHAMAFKHMSSFLNIKLGHVVDVEPALNNENDLTNPLGKCEKKIKDFYNELLNTLNKSECESAFEYIIEEILKDSKASNHGFRIIGQMLAKKNPDIVLKNLSKFNEQLQANRHKHLRCSIALWSIAQSGFNHLNIGLKIWFDLLSKYINVKPFSNLVISYLNHLLEFHKTKFNQKESEYLTIKQYLTFYDLFDDKTLSASLNKELNQKLQNSYKNLREILFKQSKLNYSDYFETILLSLSSESSAKQNEVLECAKLCLIYGKDTYTKWRQIYMKYLKQTYLLLKQISKSWSEYKNVNSNDLKQTLKYFHQNSSFYLNSIQVSSSKQQQQKHNLIKNAKTPKQQQQLNSSDLQQMQNINSLVKELVKEHISVKFSIMSRLFKLFVLIVLSLSLFFYWDINANKSIYTNQVKIQLEKLGLLDITLHIIDFVKDLFNRVKKFLAVYVPPIYQKSRKTVVYYSTIAWEHTRDYSIYVWKASEPYRVIIKNYSNQAINYIQTQLPTLTENLVSLFYLFLNYLSTLYSFLMHYFNSLIFFIETQLFGWKKGELAIVFTDGLKHVFKYLSDFFKWLNESAK